MITTEQIRQLENEAEQRGTSKLVLMERAGHGIADVLKQRFDLTGKKVLIVCYHGNNGGDGFTAARYLKDFCMVKLLFIGHKNRLKYEAAANYEQIKNDGGVEFLEETLYGHDDPHIDVMFRADIILDCILGTGVEGELKEPISSMIDKINKSNAYKVSIDIPSGIHPDTGKKSSKYVNADLIITMHDLKPGLEKLKAKLEIVVVDIGL